MLAFLLCYATSLQAQSYTADVQKLSVEDGLSSRFVTSIHKDSRGFMWIGTRYGLNRYDGYKFKLYTKENSALTTNHIGQIYEDAQQQLWLAQPVNKGLFIDILNPHTGRIQNFNTYLKPLPLLKPKKSMMYMPIPKRRYGSLLQQENYTGIKITGLNMSLPHPNWKKLIPYMPGRIFCGRLNGRYSKY